MSAIPHKAQRGEDPEQALAKAVASLEKHYGLGTVMRLGDDARQPVDTIPTGSLGLDLATGCGGYPKGRVVEIYGPESSGKTTLALHALASCQAAGDQAAFIDVEHALDPIYAASVGVQLDDLLVSQPDYGEQALDVCEQLVASGALSLVVIDSVAALVPLVELQGEMIDQQVGLQARLMSKALRKITALASRKNTCVLFVNQLRQKIGVTFGSGEVTTGGNALKFYASLRLDIRRIGRLKNDGEEIGARTRVKVVKNKLAPPFRMVELDILYGKGIYAAGEVVDMAVDRGIVSRNGAWYSLGDERLGQGRDNVARRLQTEPELRERIEGLLNGVLGLSPEPEEA